MAGLDDPCNDAERIISISRWDIEGGRIKSTRSRFLSLFVACFELFFNVFVG